VADLITPGVQFVPLLAQCPSCSVCFLVYLSLVLDLSSQANGFGLRLFAALPQEESIFEVVKMT
jgi:hypothetical protein